MSEDKQNHAAAMWGEPLTLKEVESQFSKEPDEMYAFAVLGKTYYLPWWAAGGGFLAVQPDGFLYAFADASRREIKDGQIVWKGCDCEGFMSDGVRIAKAVSTLGHWEKIISVDFLKTFTEICIVGEETAEV